MKYIVIEDLNESEKKYHDTKLSFSGADFETDDPEIPEKIRQMMQLYEYGDGSFAQEKKNFLRQGEFMKDFEDNYDGWCEKYIPYFSPSYRYLSVRQLRKYFTWRTSIRKGIFLPLESYLESSFAQLYIYELLGGIGTKSPEESFKKMQDFEIGFLNSGIGNRSIDISYLMFDYAVIHCMPIDIVKQYANPHFLAPDTYLATLKNPISKRDDEIFLALSFFAEKDLFLSPVVSEGGSKGKHLFAELWKLLSNHYKSTDNKNIFTACFGESFVYEWEPDNYILDMYHGADRECVITEFSKYFCQDGVWYGEHYAKMLSETAMFFNMFLYEAERVFRKYLKVGKYLRKKPDGMWVTQYAEAVVEADKKAEIEAKRPKINIDLSGLDKIRRDAAVTRESLLTEDEIETGTEVETTKENEENTLLDAVHTEILRTLLKKGSADEYIKAAHLMPSVIADTINSALFDEIGDNILECDGKTLKIVEDYVEEVEKLLEK